MDDPLSDHNTPEMRTILSDRLQTWPEVFTKFCHLTDVNVNLMMIMKFSSSVGNFVCCSQSILIELLIESKHSMPGIVDVLCVFFLHIFHIYMALIRMKITIRCQSCSEKGEPCLWTWVLPDDKFFHQSWKTSSCPDLMTRPPADQRPGRNSPLNQMGWNFRLYQD